MIWSKSRLAIVQDVLIWEKSIPHWLKNWFFEVDLKAWILQLENNVSLTMRTYSNDLPISNK